MKALLLTLMFAFICSFSAFSQNKFIVKMWEHSTGQPDTIDWSATVKDGTYTYVTGNTYESGEKANILTTKYNSSGGVVWEVTYNSSSNDNDYGTAIEVDASGNVYIAAASYINSTNNYDYRVIKYNSSGTLQWNSTYNGTGSLMDIPTNLLLDGSGNVYVTGGSIGSSGAGWDYATVKYNSSGTQQWVARYNYNSHDDVPGGIAINSAGKILVSGGSAQAVDNWDIASVKYNPSTGAELDSHRNSASGLGLDQVYGVAIDINDNLYIAGKTSVVGNGYDMTVIKLDSLLDTIWTKTYDLAGLDDEARGVVVDGSSNVYITGIVTTADTVKNFMTIKYNVSGTLQWSRQQGSNNGNRLDAEATDIAYEDFGDIYVTGTTDNGANLDFMTIVYSPAGTNLWIETYDGGNNDDDVPYFVSSDDNGEFYVGGRSENNITRSYTLVRYKKGGYTMPPDDDVTKPAAFTYFENKGQIIDTEGDPRDDIKYYTTRVYPAMYFMDDTVNYVFSRIDTNSATDDTLARIGMNFYNSSNTKTIRHVESQGGEYLNFFLAHTGANGITNVQHSDKLYETDVYPHVDALYYFDGAGIKYYLIIKPGYNAQSNPILINYDGATPTVLTGNKLELATDIGSVVQKSPDAYQISSTGTLLTLGWDATYTITSGKVGFTLGSYDNTKILVLEFGLDFLMGGGGDCDDNVLWGTFYAGGDKDFPTDVIVSGNDKALYMSGSTTSMYYQFPEDLDYINDLTGTVEDIFVQKFNLNDALSSFDKYEALWITYIGGTGQEYTYFAKNSQLAIISGGKKIVFTGNTQSSDLPVLDNNTADSYDIFDPDINNDVDGLTGILGNYGGLLWLTYIGGSAYNTYISGIESFDDDSFVIVGTSQGGSDFPFYDPLGTMPFYTSGRNGFILEMDKYLHPKLGTLYGSTSSALIFDVTKDNDDNYIITGQAGLGLATTTGAWQTTYGGAGDVFIAKINPDGDSRNLDWCTYYGGAGSEHGYAISTDNEDNIYVTGYTQNYAVNSSSRFPLIEGDYFNDDSFTEDVGSNTKGFLLKLDETGNALWSTLYGGDHYTYPRDIASNGEDIFITGYEFDDDDDIFTLEPSIYDDIYYDAIDGPDVTSFVMMFNKNTSLRWSTFIGDDAQNNSEAIAINKDYANEVFITGIITYGPVYYGFSPLCDPGGEAFFYDDDAGGLEGQDGFLTSFDLSMFPDITTLITEESNALFNIYPNPTTDFIYLEFKKPDQYVIDIYDMSGSKIFTKHTENSTEIISLNSFSQGSFLVSVSSSNSVYTTIIIKD